MHQRSLKRIAATLAGAQLGARLVRFFYMLVVARLLGPEETGVYLYGVALYLGALGFGLFGQHLFVAQRIGRGAPAPHVPVRHSLTTVAAALTALALLLAVFVIATEPEARIRLAVLFFVGALASRVVVVWIRAVYIATGDTGWIPRYEIGFRGLEAALGVAALFAGWGLVAISALHCLFWGVEAAAAIGKLRRERPAWLGLGLRRRYLRGIAGVSVFLLASHASMGLFPQIGVILMRRLQPDADLVGQFGIAVQFLVVGLIAPATLTQAFLPRLSRAWRFGDGGRDLITAAKAMILTGAAVAVLGHAFAPPIIAAALGESYTDAAAVFAELVWVFLPYSVVATVTPALNVVGAQRWAAGIVTAMLASHVAVMAAFLERAPLDAAIWSMAAATTAAAVAALCVAGRRIGEAGQRWWLAPGLIAALGCALSAVGWGPAVVSAPTALVAGAVLVVVFDAFDRRDRAAIRRVLGLDAARDGRASSVAQPAGAASGRPGAGPGGSARSA